MSLRICSLDIAKGITILLMVIGHSSIPYVLSAWIFSFHMPFFFMVSGLLTNWEKYRPADFIGHKAKTLMLPFVVYSVINILFVPLYKDVTLLDGCFNVILNGWDGMALWFVPVLFGALAVVKFMLGRYEWLIAVGLLLGGMALNLTGTKLPWTMSTLPIAVFFTFLGYKASRLTYSLLKFSNISKVLIISVLSSAGGIILTPSNGLGMERYHADLCHGTCGGIWLRVYTECGKTSDDT